MKKEDDDLSSFLPDVDPNDLERSHSGLRTLLKEFLSLPEKERPHPDYTPYGGIWTKIKNAGRDYRETLSNVGYWRGTNNKEELDLLKEGKLRRSRNHVTGQEEPGLSVSEHLGTIGAYGYKYAYRVNGDFAGWGSDGEPLLYNVKPETKLLDSSKVLKRDRQRLNKVRDQEVKLAQDLGIDWRKLEWFLSRT